MLWAIYLTDKPNSAELRAKHMDAHRAYLNSVDSVCFFTGPLQNDDASGSIGSLFVISGNSRADAQAFVDNEPFYKSGVFESVKIARTRKGHFHAELAE